MTYPKWQDIRDKVPPQFTDLWAWDMFYGYVELCQWNGATTDSGLPRLYILNDEENDDNYFVLWTRANVPMPPETMKEKAKERDD